MRWGALMTIASTMAAPALAQDRPLWELGIGAAALRLPHYRGADQMHNWLLPVPYVVYRGEIFKADREGARAVLVESDRFDVDLSLAASPPTRSSDNRARAGMADLAPTIEFGPNMSWTAGRGEGWKLDLRAPVRAVMTLQSSPRWIGWASTPTLNLDTRAAIPGWNLGLQAGPVFGSRRFHAYYYDVAPSEAISGRPAYRSAGGFAGTQFTTALSRRFESTWLGLYARFDTLSGAVFEASPLVRQQQQFSVGIALSWIFATSTRTVPSPD